MNLTEILSGLGNLASEFVWLRLIRNRLLGSCPVLTGIRQMEKDKIIDRAGLRQIGWHAKPVRVDSNKLLLNRGPLAVASHWMLERRKLVYIRNKMLQSMIETQAP